MIILSQLDRDMFHEIFNSSFNAVLKIPRSSPGNCQVTVVLRVPSICFSQRQSAREVRVSCLFEHMTRD